MEHLYSVEVGRHFVEPAGTGAVPAGRSAIAKALISKKGQEEESESESESEDDPERPNLADSSDSESEAKVSACEISDSDSDGDGSIDMDNLREAWQRQAKFVKFAQAAAEMPSEEIAESRRARRRRRTTSVRFKPECKPGCRCAHGPHNGQPSTPRTRTSSSSSLSSGKTFLGHRDVMKPTPIEEAALQVFGFRTPGGDERETADWRHSSSPIWSPDDFVGLGRPTVPLLSDRDVNPYAVSSANALSVASLQTGSTMESPPGADEGRCRTESRSRSNEASREPTPQSSAEDGKFQFGVVSTYQKPSLNFMTRKESTISVVQKPDEWIEILVTIDSGACVTVMPKSLCQGISIVESPESKAGVEYEVANGASIPNLGQRRCEIMTVGNLEAKKLSFQLADVHKPLLSVTACADMGFDCFLGKAGGYLIDSQTSEKIPLERRDNLYVMKAWIRQDPEYTVESFHRRG